MSAMRSVVQEAPTSGAHELSADEFAKIHGYEGGACVKVLIGPEKKIFTVPKELLCKHSAFFNGAFNSSFVEGVEQSCHLECAEAGPFRLLLQWISIERVNLPPSSAIDEITEKVRDMGGASWGGAGGVDVWDGGNDVQVVMTAAEVKSIKEADDKVRAEAIDAARSQFRQLFDFLLLADYLEAMPNPIPFVQQKMQSLCRAFNVDLINLLDSSMIVKTWELPETNLIRELLAQACTGNYIDSYILDHAPEDDWCNMAPQFQFTEELKSVPGFAAQMMSMITKTMVYCGVASCSSRAAPLDRGWDSNALGEAGTIRPGQHLYSVVYPISGKSGVWMTGGNSGWHHTLAMTGSWGRSLPASGRDEDNV